ncbi:MAG: S-adenosylmethionine decarboxylase [Candidatus Aenigmatarchaeota archaeon]
MIGVHLMIDGAVERMPSEAEIRALLSEMPAAIGMKILDGPHVVKGDAHNPGWTGFVIIDTSHISIHTFDDGCKVSMDAFSCRPFEKDFALKYITERIEFIPETMKIEFVERKTL